MSTKNSKIEYKSLVKDGFKVFILLLVISIPTNVLILKSALIIGCVATALFNIRKFKLSEINYILIIYFLFIIVGFFYTDEENKTVALFSIEKSLSFIAFPFVFSTSYMYFTKGTIDKILAIFVISAFSFGLVNALFMAITETPYLHRTYLSVNLIVAQSIIFAHLHKSSNYKLQKKITLEIILIVTTILILITKSKFGLIMSSCLLIYYTISSLKKHWYSLIKLSMMIVLIIGVLMNYEIFLGRMLQFIENGDSTRIRTWQAATEVIQNNFWVGVGTGDVVASLNQYRDIGWFPEFGQYNCHNQYLEQFVKFGIYGFLPFFSLLMYFLAKSMQMRSILFLVYMIIILNVFMIESYLLRQDGIVSFCFWLNLFYMHSKKT